MKAAWTYPRAVHEYGSIIVQFRIAFAAWYRWTPTTISAAADTAATTSVARGTRRHSQSWPVMRTFTSGRRNASPMSADVYESVVRYLVTMGSPIQLR